ncbi:MAG TPA: hypothetical protein VN736_12450 [Candidatus Limnocylindrales bacterium]|nr:hypothetical protein [Candidatus Limnocylindrales bacterium]
MPTNPTHTAPAPRVWATDYVLWVEAFALGNLAFLALDIYIAHSENDFLRRPEYFPLYFSIAAPICLALALLAREIWNNPSAWRITGYAVGLVSIALGVAGVVYHLDSQFFYERTIRSLTYAAPFAAPLAYTGVGLLLLLNRMVPGATEDWARWVVFLTLGGFFGNLVLSLTDHAGNGFFHWTEWIPVVSASFAVSFLAVFFLVPLTKHYLTACTIVLLLQAVVGVAGFALHAQADLHGPSRNVFQNIVNGAPPFAPLLFPNLMVLGLIGLWASAKTRRGQ